MGEGSQPAEFLDALVARDFARLAGCLAVGALARFLTPDGAEERSGRDEITRRLRGWFEPASRFEVVETEHAEIGPRHRLSWRFRLIRAGRSWEVIEQVAFLDPGLQGIHRLDLLCSGFLPESEVAEGQTHLFEAGAMGCADGLAQEFRRRIAGVPVGDSLAVVVSDPAAKEDLPALARMLGQSVTSVEAHDGGRLTIKVERRK